MKHHPQEEILTLFVDGKVDSPIASMISAHIERCEVCQAIYHNLVEEKSELANCVTKMESDELDHDFDLIMSKVSSNSTTNEQREIEKEVIQVKIGGQVISLPNTMNFLKDREISWKEFGKNNAIAPVITSSKGNFYLIYIGPGESVPHHSHSEKEYSYVVAGSYNDGHSSFETGDFSIAQHDLTHSPKATSEDGCLVISWVEGRLNYFSGMLKPLNSLLWWYLHKV